jgi:hypothetical protein
MSSVTRTSPSGSTSTYRYGLGKITWGERHLYAFVIDGVLEEGGLLAQERIATIVVNRVLAEHSDLSAAAWAVFVRARPHMPVPEWRFLGAGLGHGPLPSAALSSQIPMEVVTQLEQIDLG